MKAAIYPGAGQPIVIEDLADPTPATGELLIRVHRCGVCGTDLSFTKGGTFQFAPGQFGHEYAGEIVGVALPGLRPARTSPGHAFARAGQDHLPGPADSRRSGVPIESWGAICRAGAPAAEHPLRVRRAAQIRLPTHFR